MNFWVGVVIGLIVGGVFVLAILTIWAGRDEPDLAYGDITPRVPFEEGATYAFDNKGNVWRVPDEAVS